MKQYRTRFLKLVAAVFLGFPALYIILAGTLFDIPLKSCVSILLSPFYYIVCFSILVTGFGLWELARWSWYSLLFAQFLLAYENALLVFNYSESHHKLVALFLSLCVQIMVVYRISQEMRVPYLFPKIRWWESNPSYRLIVPVTIHRSNGEAIEGEILDLSMAGCFIKLRPDLNLHEHLILHFTIFGNEMEAEGTSVWVTQSAVTHPKGIGVKFGLLQRSQRKLLKSIGKKLRKIAQLYRTSRYMMTQEEFRKKLEEIETPEKVG